MDVQDFNFVREMVRSRSAIVLEDEKNYLVESRLQPLARREGFVGIAELVTKLRSNGFSPLHGKVVEAMTTNETSFYRDVQPFEALRKVILPELISKRTATRQLRIWCAASSTGQEPYSLAMLLKEHFAELANWDVKILATDLSTQVLEKARSGCFNQIEINRGLPGTNVANQRVDPADDRLSAFEPDRKLASDVHDGHCPDPQRAHLFRRTDQEDHLGKDPEADAPRRGFVFGRRRKHRQP
jgi:chemotaxis methyl-accepting protein methylase